MGWLSNLFGKKNQKKKKTTTKKTGTAKVQEIGRVEDYFAQVGVVALKLSKPLAVGDRIRVQGHTTDFTQPIKSMQIDHEPVEKARRGASVGIKVKKKCRRGDRLFKV